MIKTKRNMFLLPKIWALLVTSLKCWLYCTHIHKTLWFYNLNNVPTKTLGWKRERDLFWPLCDLIPWSGACQGSVFICTRMCDPFWTLYWHEQKQPITKHYGRQTVQIEISIFTKSMAPHTLWINITVIKNSLDTVLCKSFRYCFYLLLFSNEDCGNEPNIIWILLTD